MKRINSFEIRYCIILLSIFLNFENICAQSFNAEKGLLIWDFPSYSYDARLEIKVVAGSKGFGDQQAALFVKNTSTTTLFYKIKVNVQNNCFNTKTVEHTHTLKPGESHGGSPWFDGFEVSQNCTNTKDYGKTQNGGNFISVIDNVSIDIIQVRDIDAEKKQEELERIEEKRNSLISEGDNKFNNGDFSGALEEFNEAKQVNEELKWLTTKHSFYYDEISKKIKKAQDEQANSEKKADTDARYDDLIAKGDESFQMKNWDQARMSYEEALSIKNYETYPRNQIIEINQLQKAEKNTNKEEEKTNSSQEESNTEKGNEESANEVVESSNNESTEEKTSAAESTSSSSEESVPFDYETYYKYYATQEEKREHDMQMLYGSAAALGESIAQWQADRERKWAEEQAIYEKERAIEIQDEIAYDKLIASTNNYIFQNLETYCTLLKLSLPKVLELEPITWQDLLGTSDYDQLFGKSIDYVSKKVTVGIFDGSLASSLKNNDIETLNLPVNFSQQNLKLVEHTKFIYYWVKSDFYDHPIYYIFNDQKILVGLQIDLKTTEIHIKDYYDDLITNLDSKYFMAGANTFVSKDKICVLEFDHLTIYDLNYLAPNTLFKFPVQFNQYFNPLNCENCINQIGIKVKGIESTSKDENGLVEILEVLPKSSAERGELLTGDIILKMNDVVIEHPYQVQWFFYGFPEQKTINMTIKRANSTKLITVNY